jgi:hypothetical protein
MTRELYKTLLMLKEICVKLLQSIHSLTATHGEQ